MTANKRFTVHIKWFNYEKTEGEIELKDNGQPLLVSECIEDVQMVKELLNELVEENQYLKSLKWNQDCINEISIGIQQRQLLEEKNKELQERNNRQAKQLDDLYRLIEQKDWRALSDIMDDFKKAEEQLQSEWQTYCDDGND